MDEDVKAEIETEGKKTKEPIPYNLPEVDEAVAMLRAYMARTGKEKKIIVKELDTSHSGLWGLFEG